MSIFFQWAPNYGGGQGLSQILRGQGKGVCIRRRGNPSSRSEVLHGALFSEAPRGLGVVALWSPMCWQSHYLALPQAGIKERADPLWTVPAQQNAHRCRRRRCPAQRPARLSLRRWADVSHLAWWASRGWAQRAHKDPWPLWILQHRMRRSWVYPRPWRCFNLRLSIFRGWKFFSVPWHHG